MTKFIGWHLLKALTEFDDCQNLVFQFKTMTDVEIFSISRGSAIMSFIGSLNLFIGVARKNV